VFAIQHNEFCSKQKLFTNVAPRDVALKNLRLSINLGHILCIGLDFGGNPGICLQFIYSGYFYSTSSSLLLLIGAPDTPRILFHAEAPQATASEGLAQSPYVAAMTLRMIGVESTNEPPRPDKIIIEKRLYALISYYHPLLLPTIFVYSLKFSITLTSLHQCFYAFLGFSNRNRFIWGFETRTP